MTWFLDSFDPRPISTAYGKGWQQVMSFSNLEDAWEFWKGMKNSGLKESLQCHYRFRENDSDNIVMCDIL